MTFTLYYFSFVRNFLHYALLDILPAIARRIPWISLGRPNLSRPPSPGFHDLNLWPESPRCPYAPHTQGLPIPCLSGHPVRTIRLPCRSQRAVAWSLSDQCVLRALRVTGSQTSGDVFVRHRSCVCGYKRQGQRGSLDARMHESHQHVDAVIRCSHKELGAGRIQETSEFETEQRVYI